MKNVTQKLIVLDQNTVFYVTVYNTVFFDNQRLTVLPEHVNLDKLEKMMKEDKELNDLINKYYVASALSRSLTEKQKEIVSKLDNEIFHGFIYDYPDLTQEKGCTEIKRERRGCMIDYYGKNFILTTVSKKYDFRCIVKEIDNAVRSVDPELMLEISHLKESIAVFVNRNIVYFTDRFALRDVLSYIKNSITQGKFNEFVNTLKTLDEITTKKAIALEYFFDIALRVKRLAENSKE